MSIFDIELKGKRYPHKLYIFLYYLYNNSLRSSYTFVYFYVIPSQKAEPKWLKFFREPMGARALTFIFKNQTFFSRIDFYFKIKK